MEKLHKTLAGAALAGLLVTGGASAPAFAGDDKGDDKGGYSHDHKDKGKGKDHKGRHHDHDDERKNGEVDVHIKYKDRHGKWHKKHYEDVSLKKAASIAEHKGDDDWKKYYRDAKYTDKTGKTVHTVDEYKVDVWFKQDNDDHDHDHDHDKGHGKGHDHGKGKGKD
ncbi:MAG TPA: hypothetical protein VLK55_02600 [Kocuria rosea]|jgi:hypothetical protein|nr:hypothetical protein [Kocuria rosea]